MASSGPPLAWQGSGILYDTKMGNIRACYCAFVWVSRGASGGSLSPFRTVHSSSLVHNPTSWLQSQFPTPNSCSLVLISFLVPILAPGSLFLISGLCPRQEIP